jgi:hypothetical protein
MSEDLENIEDKGEKPDEMKPVNESGEDTTPDSELNIKTEVTHQAEESSEIKPETEHKSEGETKVKPKGRPRGRPKVKTEASKIEESLTEEIINRIPEFPKESNYQVSLINENLLRIRVSTVKSVNIDCTVKDRATPEGDASESQTNKIQIHPKHDNQPQEVEIIISIDPESGNIVVEKKKIIR